MTGSEKGMMLAQAADVLEILLTGGPMTLEEMLGYESPQLRIDGIMKTLNDLETLGLVAVEWGESEEGPVGVYSATEECRRMDEGGGGSAKNDLERRAPGLRGVLILLGFVIVVGWVALWLAIGEGCRPTPGDGAAQPSTEVQVCS